MTLPLIILLSFIVFLIVSFFYQNSSKSLITISLLKFSGVGGILLAAYWILLDCPTIIFSSFWLNTQLQSFSLSFIIDYYFVVFGSVALFVTWSIIEFSHYYMSNDPFKQPFLNTLIFFLFFMLLLVSSNSLFLLFIGWEGVGILSFILIGWWYTRSEANSSALQAIIYNRIGDIGMIIFLIFSISQFNSWNLNEIFILSLSSPLSFWALIGIVVAATGKSAQFSLHPWLPSAMEGPTPVSALLHSSTMVVAGVFLLIRCSPLLLNNQWLLNIIAILGSLTALFAASAALGQYDIKKIVAYSTTSQLGLMVVAIGFNLPWLALFHICTHAFFKALLFLCSGSIIHSLNNEQDLRKMGASGIILPFTSSALTIGSLALCGIPFLAGYYSKDLILEATQYNISNSISLSLALIATLMTAAYSSRIIYFLTLSQNSTGVNSPCSEEDFNLINPLLRLLLGALIIGWGFSISSFHSFPLLIPLLNKSAPLIVSVSAGIYLFFFSNNRSVNLNPTEFFLGSNWYYVQILHSHFFLSLLITSIKGVLRSLDQGWTAYFGPSSIPLYTIWNIKFIQRSLTGNLTNYILYFLLILVIILFSFFIFS